MQVTTLGNEIEIELSADTPEMHLFETIEGGGYTYSEGGTAEKENSSGLPPTKTYGGGVAYRGGIVRRGAGGGGSTAGVMTTGVPVMRLPVTVTTTRPRGGSSISVAQLPARSQYTSIARPLHSSSVSSHVVRVAVSNKYEKTINLISSVAALKFSSKF